MIIDTSALIAVLRAEDGYEAIVRIFNTDVSKSMSAGSLIEATTVIINRFGNDKVPRLMDLVDEARIDIVPTVRADVTIAAAAYARYGKGMGHSAQLNFGDCFAYALAKRTGEPLLCVGNDFAQTDIPLVPLEPA